MARAFGTAGVRGVFNETQTPDQVYGLAETIAFAFGRGRYGVGFDGRKTSALLAKTVAAAVNAVGSDADVFGVVPTPVIAFGTRARSCVAGFAVTASHNPPQFSGVKVFGGGGMELSKADEQRVERALAIKVMKTTGRFGETTDDPDVLEDYARAVIARYDVASSPLRIAVECASGPGGSVTPRILRALGHDVVEVNAQVSWRFPARPPEPTKGNLADFAKMVPAMGVDFGFAHDGDADRLVMVDRAGEVVPDSIPTILALRALAPANGAVVISENTSMAVEEAAEGMGLKPVRSRVGKSFELLEAEGGVFASEPSKIVDPAWGCWEDGVNAAALISSYLSKERGALERTLAETAWRYRQVNLNVGAKMPVLMAKAKEAFKRFRIEDERSLDGYKLVLHDGSWVMFRRSGTEPKTRIYCEAGDQAQLDILVQEAVKCVESSL